MQVILNYQYELEYNIHYKMTSKNWNIASNTRFPVKTGMQQLINAMLSQTWEYSTMHKYRCHLYAKCKKTQC